MVEYTRLLPAVGLASLLCISQVNSSHATNMIKYPITTTVDVGSTIDAERAAKARKLAEYATKINQSPGIVSHKTTQFDYSQLTEAVLVIDGIRYTISVFNCDESIKALPNVKDRYVPDGMGIYFRPDGTGGEKFLGYVNDDGLDGRVNSGKLPKSADTIKIKGVESELVDSILGIKFDDKVRKNLHRNRFQKIYDATITNLLGFYEKPKK